PNRPPPHGGQLTTKSLQPVADQWRGEADLILCSELLHDDRDYGMFEWLSEDRGRHRFPPPNMIIIKIKSLTDHYC
ncbi:hypothetical protein, partial [Chromobacterium phragmitis]